MKVLSLFDGMGCLYMALKELGYEVEYYASEIEKKAIEFTTKNIPGITHLGDIEKWKEWDIDWSTIDFIGSGSPCQGFSFAGKQLNFSDPRSALFFTFVDILNHVKKVNPNVKFLLENVNMKKEYLRIISEYLGLFPVRINSNLVSAQNRDRWYWTNINTKDVGLFSEQWTDIPQPEDEGILLKDILQLESEVDEKYYINNPKMLKFITDEWRLDKKYTQIDGEKSLPQLARQYQTWCGDYISIREVRTDEAKKQRKKTGTNNFRGKKIEVRTDGKIAALQTSLTIEHSIIQLSRGFNKGGQHKEKTPTLTSNSWEQNNILKSDFKLRRLTPTECARLQTIPEWVNFNGFSDTAIYKMLGNGWTVKVITHILKHL